MASLVVFTSGVSKYKPVIPVLYFLNMSHDAEKWQSLKSVVFVYWQLQQKGSVLIGGRVRMRMALSANPTRIKFDFMDPSLC